MKTAAYIGWVGHENLGDEACYDAVKAFLKNSHALVPWDRGRWPRKALPDLCIVGGGTLLDIRFKRREQALVYPMFNNGIPVVFWGSGVVTPYGKTLHPKVAAILRGSKFVGVRGPRSKKILAAKGFPNVEIIGDPALFLRNDHSETPYKKNSDTIAINIGHTRNNLYGTEKHVLEQTKILIQLLERIGFNILLFSVWPEDNKLLNQVKGKNVRLLPWSPNINNLLGIFKQCYCVVGLKLHAVVLSATVGVPFVSLAYREKCFDFVESLDLDKWAVRTDKFEARHQDSLELRFEPLP